MDLSGITFCKKKLNVNSVDISELFAMDACASAIEIREFYEKHGYLFFRDLIPRELVLNARDEILQKYAIIGEVDDRQPIRMGMALNRSYREEVNIRALRQSIVSGYYYQSVSRFSNIQNIVSKVLDYDAQMLNYLWPRMIPTGTGTGLHQDAPFFQIPSDLLVSVWTPLGDVSPTEGALVILEGSHKSETLKHEYGNKDADKEKGFGWYNTDLEETQRRIGGQWLTADFNADDVLIFSQMTLHGAFDNNSAGKIRLSSDSRFQSTELPIDPRWAADNATGRSAKRVFLPQSTCLETISNPNLSTEFHDIDDFGKIDRT
ncbi:MAG: phytanoyl-CoA dioxygenase family protein [Algicola sp.]|nr:phytanoyl-CoA dioxygenase family protein [Algicola sp.]